MVDYCTRKTQRVRSLNLLSASVSDTRIPHRCEAHICNNLGRCAGERTNHYDDSVTLVMFWSLCRTSSRNLPSTATSKPRRSCDGGQLHFHIFGSATSFSGHLANKTKRQNPKEAGLIIIKAIEVSAVLFD